VLRLTLSTSDATLTQHRPIYGQALRELNDFRASAPVYDAYPISSNAGRYVV
jgi:hypothetical protein